MHYRNVYFSNDRSHEHLVYSLMIHNKIGPYYLLSGIHFVSEEGARRILRYMTRKKLLF